MGGTGGVGGVGGMGGVGGVGGVGGALEILAGLLDGGDAWVVGGAVRDKLLGRETTDFDVVVRGDPRRLAQGLARGARAHPFELSEGFGAWRVVAHDRSWQLDLLPLGEKSLEADLAQRDLTINAIAQPLGGGEYVDPFGGRADLRARCLRMVSPGSFESDPLRTVRVARLGCELEFSVEAGTVAAARAATPGLSAVAAERIFAELKRILTSNRAVRGLELMDELAVTDVILPELSRLRGVEQSKYHHLDVHDHTRAVVAEVIALEREPERFFPRQGQAVLEVLAEPLANELTRGQALRFGALFHDVAKPQTRRVSEQGRVTFIGHDETGAALARTILARLRASDRLQEYVAALARHHLRLGFLVHEIPLTRRTIYTYLRACEPVQVDVTLLSVADRLATRGRNSEIAIARHLELARELMAAALAWRRERPRPPIRGDELARALDVAPGPTVGRLLADLEAASYAGEISGREEAVRYARSLLAGRCTADR